MMSVGEMTFASSWSTMSRRTVWASDMSSVERLRLANAETRMSAPSSSRMFDETTVAMYSSTSSGMCSRSLCAFLRRIAMRVSRSGACTSVMRPHSNRLRMRSSKPVRCFGGTSLVITTCLS